MKIIGIDPGTATSGVAILDTETMRVTFASGNVENRYVRRYIASELHHCAIECFNFQGKGVGDTVFETCYWIGEFRCEWRMKWGTAAHLIKRSRVHRNITLSGRADDSTVRGFLIERFGGPGKKSAPGPTYGVTSHAWQALAVAATLFDILTGAAK